MSELIKLIDRLATEDVYLINEFERIAIRSDHASGKFYAKPRGVEEYEIHHSTVLVTDTLMEGAEISKNKYLSY